MCHVGCAGKFDQKQLFHEAALECLYNRKTAVSTGVLSQTITPRTAGYILFTYVRHIGSLLTES